jgi:hypothetical protein
VETTIIAWGLLIYYFWYVLPVETAVARMKTLIKTNVAEKSHS